MPIFKAGLGVSLTFIGVIAAILGLVVIVSSWRTGAIMLSYGASGPAAETVSYATDPDRFWKLVAALGFAPLILGALAARWGLSILKPAP